MRMRFRIFEVLHFVLPAHDIINLLEEYEVYKAIKCSLSLADFCRYLAGIIHLPPNRMVNHLLNTCFHSAQVGLPLMVAAFVEHVVAPSISQGRLNYSVASSYFLS